MFNPFRKKQVRVQDGVQVSAQDEKLGAIKESAEVLGRSVAKVIAENNKGVAQLIAESERRIMEYLSKFPVERIGYGRTVFGFYLVKMALTSTTQIPFDSMLILVVASDVAEADVKKNEIMSKNGYKSDEWRVALTNSLPIIAEENRFTVVSDSTEDTKKEQPIEAYINNLLYARDNFAKTPHEKGVLTRIINSIKK